MRPLASGLLVLTLAGFSVDCAPYARARGIPIGTPAPARPPDCKLSYARIAPPEAQAEWRQVGDVCLTGDVYWPGEAGDALSEKVCALGGEMVTPIGLCANGKMSAIEFGVYVRR
jgi:hypothetical protein